MESDCMNKKIALIGGDLRMVKLAQMIEQDGNEVATYGMEKAELTNIKKVDDIKKAISMADIIISAIPFSKDGIKVNAPYSDKIIDIKELAINRQEKIFIAGNINENIYSELNKSYKSVIDIMKKEELVILNTIATAEGAVKIVIEGTEKILQGSNVLILGFGRVGKVVANKFSRMGCNVTCGARKATDLAWIQADGYKMLNINEMDNSISQFDIIINTVPKVIVNRNMLEIMKKDVLIIDLASNPGGIDRKAVQELNLNLNWALALPRENSSCYFSRIYKTSYI